MVIVRKPIRTLARVALISALIVITYGSLEPAPAMPSVTNIDKVLHVIAYAGVAGTAAMTGWMRIGTALAFAIAWGIGIEVLQHMLPTGRTASLADMLANTIGAFAGGAAASQLLRLARVRQG